MISVTNIARTWCVLRTSGPATLRLNQSLTDDGFEAWTPTVTVSRRRPRSRACREVPAPMLPTFVFVRASRLDELVRLSLSHTKAQPGFSLLKHLGGWALIADRDLEPLRVEERRAVPKAKRRLPRLGETVRLTEGGFAGMAGIVERAKGDYVLVCFPGWSIPVKIAAFHLHVDDAKEAAHRGQADAIGRRDRTGALHREAAPGATERAHPRLSGCAKL